MAPSTASSAGRVGVVGVDRAVGAKVSVFAAPIARAPSVAASASASAASLCGIVTLAPPKPAPGQPADGLLQQLGRDRQALVVLQAGARACIAGERLCPTGQPSTP